MHDLLFEGQEQWSGNAEAVDVFKEMAAELGLDQVGFDSCLDSDKYADEVLLNLDEAVAAGMSSTPSFLIGQRTLAGAQSFLAFQEEIEYSLFLAEGGEIELEVGADSFRSVGEPDAPVVVTEFADFQ